MAYFGNGRCATFAIIKALNLIKKHTPNFAGDPKEETIAGGSAGSIIVTILLLAPQAKGLYHKDS